MSQITSTGSTGSTSSTSSADSNKRGNGLQDLNLDQFLNLIITELQNQDPLSPTDNAALMQQVGQLRSMAADDKLTTTLTNFSITQQLTTASSLIGQKVIGLDDTGSNVNGIVDSVSVKIDEKDSTKRQVKVQVEAKSSM